MKRIYAASCLLTMLLSQSARTEDWPSFRGPQGNGQSSETHAPLQWSAEKNVRWKVALPRPGNGSPIVSAGSVFVVCSEDEQGKRRSLYSFDRHDGRQRWVRTVEYAKDEETHKTNPHGSSTPAADGKQVVVWHGSAGLYCYDFSGNQKWSKELGEFPHMWGYGTSPIIYRDRVIMHCGPGPKVFVTAVELSSGKTLWTTDEPVEGDGNYRQDKEYMGSWTTPIVVRIGERDQILCAMPTRVVSYDPADGKILWSCEGLRGKKGDLAYSSPVMAGEICINIGGFGGPGMAFKVGGSGDITSANRLWRNETNPQSIGSGIVVDGHFYRANAGGRATIDCIDPASGKVLWSSPDFSAAWGSIVYAAGRGYLTNQQGVTIVFRPNPQRFELLAENDLDEASNATPAISDGQIFLRTNRHLYCIADKSP
jgi:outer membrane protein assembly factor BamB